MNIKDNYTINPYYILKNDKRRAIITNRVGRDYLPEMPANDSFFSIIHPLHAMILSFFTDEKTLDEKIIEISNFLGNNPKNVYNFVSKLCNNKNDVYQKFSNHSFSFPKNTLVKNRNYTGPKYKIEDFNVSKDQYDFKSKRLNIPLDILLVINTDCITDCIYCYANKNHKFTSLPFNRIKELVLEAKALGMRNMDISGGEFLLHKDWGKILSLFIENGFHPYLSTKVPMDEKTIKKLKDIGVKSMQVSVDTLIEKEARVLLNVQNGYIDKLMNTLKLLDKSGIEIITNTIITKYNSNLDSIQATFNFLSSLQNTKRINFAIGSYSIYRRGNYLNYKPDINDIKRIDEFISGKSNDFKGKIRTSLDYYYTDEIFNNDAKIKEEKFTQRAFCTGNASGFVVLPDGKVTICEELYWHPSFIIGDLSKESILDVWNSQKAKELYFISKEKISINSACKKCEVFNNCRLSKGVCWKIILMAYGDEKWDYPDPRCQLAPEPESIFFINS